MSQDDYIFHAPHRKAEEQERLRAEAEAKHAEEIERQTPKRFRHFSTLEAKTQLSRILREMERGDFDAAVITSYGRRVGIIFPQRMLGGG